MQKLYIFEKKVINKKNLHLIRPFSEESWKLNERKRKRFIHFANEWKRKRKNCVLWTTHIHQINCSSFALDRRNKSNWKRKRDRDRERKEEKRSKKKNENKTAATTVNFANNLKIGMEAFMWCNVLHRWNITLLIIKMQIFIVCNNLRLLIYGLLFVTQCHAGRIFGKFLSFYLSLCFRTRFISITDSDVDVDVDDEATKCFMVNWFIDMFTNVQCSPFRLAHMVNFMVIFRLCFAIKI